MPLTQSVLTRASYSLGNSVGRFLNHPFRFRPVFHLQKTGLVTFKTEHINENDQNYSNGNHKIKLRSECVRSVFAPNAVLKQKDR